MRGKDQIEKSGKPRELTSYWNSVGLEVPVSNIVNAHFHLSRAGGSSIHVFWQTCKVATACSQTHHPSSFKLRTKAASRINRALLYATGLPAWSPSSLVSQLPGHHRHLLGSNCPANTTQHTQPTQRSLLHKTTFFKTGRESDLTNSYKKQNEKTEE